MIVLHEIMWLKLRKYCFDWPLDWEKKTGKCPGRVRAFSDERTQKPDRKPRYERKAG